MLSKPILIFKSTDSADSEKAKLKEKSVSKDSLMHYHHYLQKADDFDFEGRENGEKGGQSEAGLDQEYRDKYKEGVHDAFKETIKEQYKNRYKFYGIVNKTSRLIHRMKNIIPVFRAEVLVDPSKITIIHRPFFFSEQIQSVTIEDINHIWIETVPFLATMNIVEKGFTDNVIRVRWIWKKKAEKARRIIMGLIEARREEVDLTAINHEELVARLEEIGELKDTNTTVSGA